MNATDAACELKPLANFRALPGNRGRISKRSLIAWASSGIRVRGRVIRLRAERIGWRWFTCAAWVDEFIAATNKIGQEPKT